MKHRHVIKMLIVCACFCVAIFTSTLFAYLSDVLTQSINVGAASIDVELTNMQLGFERNGMITWIDLENETFDETLVQNDVMLVRFSITNNSWMPIVVDVDLELSLLGDSPISETNIFFVYPDDVSSQDILDQLSQMDDSQALIGFNTPAIHPNTTGSDVHEGYQLPILDAVTLSPQDRNVTMSVKVVLSDVVYDIFALRNWIQNNELGIGISLDAQLPNETTSWNHADYIYRTLPLDLELEPKITLLLNGPDIDYVSVNTPYQDPGATAVNEWGDPLTVSVSGTVNTAVIGIYSVTYCAQQDALQECISRTVRVTDGQNPLITPLQTVVERFVSPTLDLGIFVTLSDNRDSPAVLRQNLVITTPEPFASTTPGVYQICYNVTDQSGLSAPEVCITLTMFAFEKVEMMLATTVALTTHGKVYTWGRNNLGQAGLGTSGANVLVPTRIPTLDSVVIVDIDAGTDYGMALSETGAVYIWGSDAGGVQGNGPAGNNLVPTLVQSLGTVVQIEASHQTALVLNSQGNVYSWGSGFLFATGYGISANQLTPRQVIFPNNQSIRMINHGWYTGFALSTTNTLFGWGSGQFGILMPYQTTTTTNYATPLSLNLSVEQEVLVSTIETISTGRYHGYLITNQGRLYAWGRDQYGQLGNGSGTRDSFIPELVAGLSDSPIPVTQISAGQEYGVALTQDGQAYVWGRSQNYTIGYVATVHFPNPVCYPSLEQFTCQPTDLRFKYVSAYQSNTALVGVDGRIYMVGSNTNGELGRGTVTIYDSRWAPVTNPQ